MAASTVSYLQGYRDALDRTASGINLATRHAQHLPAVTIADRQARAGALMSALRVMRFGTWRPCFPFHEPRR